MTPIVHLSASLWCLLLAGAVIAGVVRVVLRVRAALEVDREWEPGEL